MPKQLLLSNYRLNFKQVIYEMWDHLKYPILNNVFKDYAKHFFSVVSFF